MGGRTPVRTAQSYDKRVGWGLTHRGPQSSGPGGLGSAAPAPGSAGSVPPGRRGRCCPPASAWPPRARPGWSCPGDPGFAGPARSGCSHTRPESRGRPSRRLGDLGGTARTCPQSRRGVGTVRKPRPVPPQAPPRRRPRPTPQGPRPAGDRGVAPAKQAHRDPGEQVLRGPTYTRLAKDCGRSCP